jgi:hypothetical protein
MGMRSIQVACAILLATGLRTEGAVAQEAARRTIDWSRVANVSLVARDWDGSRLLLGHLSLVDQVRMSRSSRMLVTRVRVGQWTVVPFAQAGMGQWRIDSDRLSALRRDAKLAGQLGGGFELTIAHGATVALEADYTLVYQERGEPPMFAGAPPWGALLAARSPF